MSRKIRFREHPAIVQRRYRAHMLAQITDPEQRARYIERFPESELPALPRTRTPAPRMPGVDIDKVHKQAAPLEADVLRAVSDLLAAHPRVSYALRINSGMASYEAKTGKYAPVYFHKWLRAPTPCKMPDIFGALIDGRTLALEIKRPGWSKPRDEREHQQANFLALIRDLGGIGAFVTDARQLEELLK